MHEDTSSPLAFRTSFPSGAKERGLHATELYDLPGSLSSMLWENEA